MISSTADLFDAYYLVVLLLPPFCLLRLSTMRVLLQAEDTDAIAKELALAEQARRNYRKIADWQLGDGVIYKIWVWQLGDLFVVGVPGEPYSELQVMIREALPEKHVIVSVRIARGRQTDRQTHANEPCARTTALAAYMSMY
jgi:hypothetical protein